MSKLLMMVAIQVERRRWSPGEGYSDGLEGDIGRKRVSCKKSSVLRFLGIKELKKQFWDIPGFQHSCVCDNKNKNLNLVAKMVFKGMKARHRYVSCL
jgi:hypothetical protein